MTPGLVPILQDIIPSGPIDQEWIIRLGLAAAIAVAGWWAKREEKDKETERAEKLDARKEVTGLITAVTELTGSVREMKDVTRLTYDVTRENKSTLDRIERRQDQVIYDRSRDK